VALFDNDHVDIIELIGMQRRLRFTVDHVVRRSTIAWFGRDALAIHTDYGCASLYAVP
jgi:hypothetical protein